MDKPRIHLNSKVLPNLKSYQVGETYKFTVEAELVSLDTEDHMAPMMDGRDEDYVSGRFRVAEIKNPKMIDPMKASKKEYKNMLLRGKSGKNLYD